ncbi:ABC transporter permease subunit [Bacillus sp. 2205SS5-2]|uniref:ABC transporter permease subunit n=1 Tax=Bacillus sp. 2205SS5-2 TaxID=3109031 RepID=UPI0030047F23
MRNFLRKVMDKSMQLVLACIGIILIGALPYLLTEIGEWKLNWQQYFDAIEEIIIAIFNLDQLTYYGLRGAERPLFPYLYEPILYSLTLLLGALVLAACVALLLTYITMLFSERKRRNIKLVFYLLESIPDLFIIIMFQLFVVYFYKKTNVLLAEIATIDQSKAYLMPVLCLAILPTVQFYRLSMLTFENEEKQNYVELARSIGFGKTAIFLKHMFPNAIISVFFQSKKIIWFMLSNLFVLEFLFNVPGISWFLMENMQPKVVSVTLIAIFLPVFVLYAIGEWLIERKANKGEVML